MKKNAFTLAEVLLVIGIIGIVATVTLPNLSRNTSDADTVAKVKKTVATLQTALDMAKDKYGEDILTWTASDSLNADKATRIGSRLAEFLSVSKTCGLNTNQGCFASSNVTVISSSTSYTSMDKNANSYKFVLNDGVSVAVNLSGTSYLITFDIDGPNKGLNKRGRDIFQVALASNDGTFNWHEPTEFDNSNGINSCRSGISAFCIDWIMHFGNMDYVNCSGLTRTNTTCH